MLFKLSLVIFTAVVFFFVGYAVANNKIESEMGSYFTRAEVMDAHGSFDVRLNRLEERLSEIETSNQNKN